MHGMVLVMRMELYRNKNNRGGGHYLGIFPNKKKMPGEIPTSACKGKKVDKTGQLSGGFMNNNMQDVQTMMK